MLSICCRAQHETSHPRRSNYPILGQVFSQPSDRESATLSCELKSLSERETLGGFLSFKKLSLSLATIACDMAIRGVQSFRQMLSDLSAAALEDPAPDEVLESTRPRPRIQAVPPLHSPVQRQINPQRKPQSQPQRKPQSGSRPVIFVDASFLPESRAQNGSCPGGVGVIIPSLNIAMSLEIVAENSSTAEAFAVQTGAAMAHALGLRDFIIKTDSMSTAKICSRRRKQPNRTTSHSIALAIPLPPNVSVEWVPREKNRAADRLSKLASKYSRSALIRFAPNTTASKMLDRCIFVSTALRSDQMPSGVLPIASAPCDVSVPMRAHGYLELMQDLFSKLTPEWKAAQRLELKPGDARKLQKLSPKRSITTSVPGSRGITIGNNPHSVERRKSA